MCVMSLTHVVCTNYVVHPRVSCLLFSKQLFYKHREDSLQKILQIAKHKRKHLICSSDTWS